MDSQNFRYMHPEEVLRSKHGRMRSNTESIVLMLKQAANLRRKNLSFSQITIAFYINFLINLVQT